MSIANSNSPYRRRGFLIAAAVLVVIALLAVIAVVSGLFGGGDDAPLTAAPTIASSAPAALTDSDPSACGLEGYETASSLTTAPDNKWELVGTVAAPIDPAVGPGRLDDDGFRTCYSHTAEGALFAAANSLAMGSDATYASRMIELVAPGPGRDALRDRETSGSSSAVRYQIAGFAVLSYSGDAATIDMAVNRSSDGQLISFPFKLEWIDGDWKFLVSDNGSNPIAPAAIDSLGGYIPWSGA